MDIPSNEIPRENFDALKKALVSAANATVKKQLPVILLSLSINAT